MGRRARQWWSGDLKVDVEGAPGLVQSDYMTDDKDASSSRREFEELAWEAATAKARELGWIV